MNKYTYNKLNRRRVLQTIVGGAVGSAVLPSTVTANACDDDSACVWEDTAADTAYSDPYKLQQGYGLEYYGSYKDNKDRIHHDFDLNNTAVSRYYSGSGWEKTNHTESIEGHWVEVDADYASNALITGDDSTILGVTPPETLDYSAIAATETAIKAAIGMIDPALGLTMTAGEIADELRDDPGSESGPTNTERHDWGYGSSGQPHEASHHWEFFIMMNDNCDDTYFEVTSSFYNWYAGRSYVSTSYNIQNTDCGGLSSYSTTWTPVPIKKIRNDPRLTAIADGGPLWFATLPIEVVNRTYSPPQ